MSLPAASRLGPYEILSPLGAGGMGEVYRARDTRLGREVAVKVLPEEFSGDPERLRRFEQFEGSWALPGGFVEFGETTEEACVRETLEETSLAVQIETLLGVFSKPGRDPRGHTVSVVYRCRPVGGEMHGGNDAAEARWCTPEEIGRLSLAFDHAEIVRKGLKGR